MCNEIRWNGIAAILTDSPLFSGLTTPEIDQTLHCTGARLLKFQAGDVLLHEQMPSPDIGLLLEGRLQASMLEPSGKQFLVSQLENGQLFGDVLAVGGRKSPITLTAVSEARTLWIPFERVLARCAKACPHHDRLLYNLFDLLSQKYFDLHDRIYCLIQPNLRQKILFYLGAQTLHQEETGQFITLPFDRESLARYLNTERSALSRELSAMKRDGLIDYHKNVFRLL